MPHISYSPNLSTEIDRISTALPGFTCGLCPAPIRYRHRWHRDLLIQAVLDPDIEGLEPLADRTLQFAFVIRRGTVRAVVVALHDDMPRPPVEGSLPVIYIQRSNVVREPIVGAARAVWATRRYPVSATDRVRILATFDQSRQKSLRDLAGEVRVPAEGVDAVLSLVCQGTLAIRLQDGLSPDTKVSLRGPTSRPSLELGRACEEVASPLRRPDAHDR